MPRKPDRSESVLIPLSEQLCQDTLMWTLCERTSVVKDVKKYLLRVRNEGMYFLNVIMKNYHDAVLRAIDCGSNSFLVSGLPARTHLESTRPKLFFDLVTRALAGCAESLRQFRILSTFFSRAEVIDPSKDSQCIQNFVSRQERKFPVSVTDSSVQIGHSLSRQLVDIVSTARPGFRHGPGSVSDTHLTTKDYCVALPLGIPHNFPYKEALVSKLSFDHIGIIDRTTKVVCVPKDYRGPRIISCECTSLQFLQNHLMTSIQDAVPRITRGRVNFEDQSINRSAACSASYNAKYATIDLKDASDLVSWELCKKLFDQSFLDILAYVRSTHTRLPDGRLIELVSAFPMGSALCFPIESIVFSAIVGAVTDDYFIYGDDIVVPVDKVSSVIRCLELGGLIVNKEKSYISSHPGFRESCGGDFLRGVDVSIPRFPRGQSLNMTRTECANLSNVLYNYGYMNASSYLSSLFNFRHVHPSVAAANPNSDLLSCRTHDKNVGIRVDHLLQRNVVSANCIVKDCSSMVTRPDLRLAFRLPSSSLTRGRGAVRSKRVEIPVVFDNVSRRWTAA